MSPVGVSKVPITARKDGQPPDEMSEVCSESGHALKCPISWYIAGGCVSLGPRDLRRGDNLCLAASSQTRLSMFKSA